MGYKNAPMTTAGSVLAGPGHSVAREWNEAGVVTRTGGTWHPSVVARLLRSARIAGFRD